MTVSEVIRGNSTNQNYFAKVEAPSEPPKPALVVLLLSMITDKQSLQLRNAVLYCVHSYLYKNEAGKADIVSTLLPSSVETTVITTGHVLCTGLLNSDPLNVWFSASALSHCLVESQTQKELLLKVQLAKSLGNPPTTLLQQCTSILMQTSKVQMKIALLMLLSQWLANSPLVVAQFIGNSSVIPFLTADIAATEGDEVERVVSGLCAFLFGICYLFNDDSVEKFKRNALLQILENRIGVEAFTEKISVIPKSEAYIRVARKPYIYVKDSGELIFDHEFAVLFKGLEGDILRSLRRSESALGATSNGYTQSNGDAMVKQYQEIVKQQDSTVGELRESVKKLESEIEHWRSQVHTLQAELISIKALPQAQAEQCEDDVVFLKGQLKERDGALEQKDQIIAQLTKDVQELSGIDPTEALRSQITELESQLQFGWKKFEELTISAASEAEEKAKLQAAFSGLEAEKKQLEKQIQDHEHSTASQLELKNKALEHEQARVSQLEQQVARLEAQLKTGRESHVSTVSPSGRSASDVKAEQLEKELVGLKREQEDLLVLLADQDQKMLEYRSRLKQFGVQLDSDDGDEDNIRY